MSMSFMPVGANDVPHCNVAIPLALVCRARPNAVLHSSAAWCHLSTALGVGVSAPPVHHSHDSSLHHPTVRHSADMAFEQPQLPLHNLAKQPAFYGDAIEHLFVSVEPSHFWSSSAAMLLQHLFFVAVGLGGRGVNRDHLNMCFFKDNKSLRKQLDDIAGSRTRMQKIFSTNQKN